MTFSDIENLLSAQLGFDVESVGRKAVESTLSRLMEEEGFSDPVEYAAVLARDRDAWRRLVDRAVVRESWFFRDVAPFELALQVARARIRAASGKIFRILSCPCSTGEEPYSLVMAMLQGGVSPESFRVEAIDVSLSALESARTAQFRARSFRDDALWYRAAYFDHVEGDGLWSLNESVKLMVNFRQENCVAPDFLNSAAPYDLIFCRNLLIYLHSDGRGVVLKSLRRLLTEDGVLVLGNSEAAIAREHGFVPTGPLGAFAFTTRRQQGPPAWKAPSRQKAAVNAPSMTPAVGTPAVARSSVVPPVHAKAAPVPVPEPVLLPEEAKRVLLAEAHRLGDAGKLEEALERCRNYLQHFPDSAKAYFLLGVLQDALGHPGLAAESFRKVLYLDPGHRGALLHLALKREAVGDASGAALLRARARRYSEGEGSEQS